MLKRLCAFLLALVTVLGMTGMVSAASAEIEETEYEGLGKVDVEFFDDMEFKNLKVTVTDPDGNKLDTTIIGKDEDSIDFKVTGLKPSTKYIYKISKVRVLGTSTWKTVKGSFKTPAQELGIKKVTYDREDKELDVDLICSLYERQ